MAVYRNQRSDTSITSVEFTPVSDGNFAFFHIDSSLKKDAVKKWLTSNAVGQEIIAETMVDGHPVLISHGDKNKDEMLKVLNDTGEKLKLHHHEKPFDYWALRGGLSIVGQSLQLASGKLRTGGIDAPTVVFAVSNLAANAMNIIFGAQKKEDLNRLRFLKSEFNHDLGDHLCAGECALPELNEKRASLRKEPPEPKTIGQKTYNFLQKYSVTFGEIGLRFFGAAALAFPVSRWGRAAGSLKAGKFAEAYKVARNSTLPKGVRSSALTNEQLAEAPANLAHTAGMSYLGGKTLALFSKVPDPYDQEPHSWLDTFREKYVFRLSSAIEGVAATALAYKGFAKEKITIGGKETPDFLGGTGGALFATAFLVRYFAKFGVNNVNMDELYAHVADSLAQVPPNELPQLIAESAATIKEHFKDQNMDYGKVYTQMMTDLYRYHHIALDNLGTEPEERLARLNGKHVPTQGVQTLVTAPKNHLDRVAAPAKSHIEGVISGKSNGEEISLSV